MRVAVIGAGAIGSWLGVQIARAGHEVHVLARGATLEQLREGPWRLDTPAGSIEARVAASDDPAVLGKHDLVVIAVKGPALVDVAPAARALLDPAGIALPVMNGVPWWFADDPTGAPLASVDAEARIAAAIPIERVVGAVAHVSASSIGPAHVRQVAGNGLIVGEPGGGESKRVAVLADALLKAGVEVTTSTSIRHAIWYKLWGNMTINPIAALTGATADRVLDDPLTEALVCRVMEEARTIGVAIGCVIDEDAAARIAVTRRLGAFRPSMLQDVEADRPLEVDALLAAPREIAVAHGLPTPALDALLGLTRLFAANRCRRANPPQLGER